MNTATTVSEKTQERREKLARNIATIREAFGISIVALAEYLGHHKRTTTLRIRCPWLFTVEDLEMIADLGGVTLDELMCGDLVKTVRVLDARRIEKEKKTNV